MMNSKCAIAALGAAALLAAPAPVPALPLISEVLYDAVGTDDGRLFVEIYGAPGASLDGLTLEGVNGADGAVGPVLALAGAIPADGFFVLADQTSTGTTEIPNADLLANFDLQNGPDSLVLRGPLGVLDAVGYGVFAAGEVFAGEGAPAPDPAAGFSVARLFANVDTNDNAADFAGLDIPTPGTGPIAPIPEPGSALLLGCGLGCAAALRRKGP
jgi:hypothetical protein